MFKQMMQLLSKNYRSYFSSSIIYFIVTFIFDLFILHDPILATILYCFGTFCGFWFLDIRKKLLNDVTKISFIEYITPITFFVGLFILISILVSAIYDFAFFKMVIIFCMIQIFELIENKLSKKS